MELNKQQREAVETIEGPVMVVAGPGTGKTQILARRVAEILKRTDTPPDAILALTFTEAGVHAMRKRLISIMGDSTAYRVPVFTFHGFCNEVIGRYQGHFPQFVGCRPASALEKIEITRSAFDAEKLKVLASFRSPYNYVKAVLSNISLLKREGLSPEDFSRRLDEELKDVQAAADYRHEKGAHKGKVKKEYRDREEMVAKNRELLTLYRRYEELLAERRLYDFDDMILAVVHGLKTDEDLRLMLQEEYQYILADEHQDANGAQNTVLEELSSYFDSPNLFIVGDDKQAIYRFQGASLENFNYFKRKFPKAKLIALEENYRSTQTVLDASHKLVAPRGVRLLARAGHPENKITINEYETVAQEARELACKIKELIAEGGRAEEIAVFTRKNEELGLYGEALSRAGVPISVLTKKDALDDLGIDKLLTIIKAVATVGEDTWFVKALHLSCFNVPELDIYTLVSGAKKRKETAWRVVGGGGASREIKAVADMILKWAKLGYNVGPAELVSTIAKESGLMAEFISAPDAEDKMAMMSKLLSHLSDFTRSRRSARLPELLELLLAIDEYDVLETDTSGRMAGRVQMMTAHRSKGLEFDNVFIVGAVEGNWSGGRNYDKFKIPGLNSISKEDEEDDDRRLFYVAITRARRGLTISYAKAKTDGRMLSPCRFLEDLPTELVLRCAPGDTSDVAARAEELSPVPARGVSREDIMEFVRETFFERGLAVTALNNYLACPWRYFYRNLLRLPEPENPAMMYGTAIHGALRAFFEAVAEGRVMSAEELSERFNLEATRCSFTDKELEEVLEEGAESLAKYVAFYGGEFEKNNKCEMSVEVGLEVEGGVLRLNGKLDRADFVSSGEVRVFDYKTGEQKSRNEIEGKTKNSDGDYKRQLVFYNLLLNKYDNGSLKMRSGVIDFVTPGDNGKVRREEFEIGQGEVEELETTIKRVAGEITNLSFWGARCDDEGCEYCHLRQMMR